MPYLPDLTENSRSRSVVDVFGGYNHNPKINEGEWYDAQNLSSAAYPLFSPRHQRRIYKSDLVAPAGIAAKDALAWIDGKSLYYNGMLISGITLSDAPDDNPKQMISMGAYLCIFPDGVYLNTKDLSDFGSMGANYISVEGASIDYAPCDLYGKEYSDYVVSPSEPENPANGDYWLDTSSDTHSLKQYSATSGMWVDIPTVYTKISANGINDLFSQYDGVTISGCAYGDEGTKINAQINALNGDKIIYALGDGYIVVVGIIDQAVNQAVGQISVKREVPVMDYVCESNNRIWGCRYGMTGGKMLNEIYACKLGDFKNWRCYMGISTDSYAVSVGTDGPFTACASYLGYTLFFKENAIHKIYGTMPSNYQVQNTNCRGVQNGSWRSVQVVNETLIYKSRSDICAYDGSLPQSISSALGEVRYSEACAGTVSSIYYVSMKDDSNAWHLFVYDANRAIWHREDDAHVEGFAQWSDSLFAIIGSDIVDMRGLTGDAIEDPVHWRADSGMIGYELVDHEYVSRFNIRMRMEHGSNISMFLEYDSDGVWHDQGMISAVRTDTFNVPVIPRRCDHFRVRLCGVGNVYIYSLSKIVEQGSDAS